MPGKLRLDKRVNIKTKISTPIGGGESRKSYVTSQTNVKANVQPVTLQDVFRGARKIQSKAYKCYLDPSVTISQENRITFEGSDYSIYSEPSYPGAYKKVWLEKII